MTSARGRRLRRRIALAATGAVAIAITGFLVWCSILYPPEASALASITDDPAITTTVEPEALVLAPTTSRSTTGLVFIPGAKVAPEAYANKLGGLVRSGVTVVITKPVLNLAFFDLRPVSQFTALAPDVDTWFVGGHSLGGVRACQFASDPDVAGLVLFGSFCANDLSGSDVAVLSVGGSVDGLSTPADIADNAGKLPAAAELVEIAGASHASFGDYGLQPGDGTATITSVEMESRLTELLTDFVR